MPHKKNKPTAPQPVLAIENLHVSVDKNEILKGISLSVQPGEVHAIMGPNGSGKSTLAATLAGHPNYEVTNGSISVSGVDLVELSPDERAHLGVFLAFQYPVEVPGVRVQNFLRMAHSARFAKNDKKTFARAIDFRTHLKKLAETLRVNSQLLERGLNEGFSGGEKKQVEILQMAVLEPVVAILDETDSGLDVDAIKKVSEGVKKIVTSNNTGVLVITHYQRILEYLHPDFVHILVNGKIMKSGGPELAKEVDAMGYQRDVVGEKSGGDYQ